MQLEQSIRDQLATTLTMPVFAFSTNPEAVRKIGADGVCLVVYAGSNNESAPNGSNLKRTMTASVLLIAGTPAFIHSEMLNAYQSIMGFNAAGCEPMRVIDDELALSDSGLYQAVMTVEVKTYRVG